MTRWEVHAVTAYVVGCAIALQLSSTRLSMLVGAALSGAIAAGIFGLLVVVDSRLWVHRRP